MATKTATAQAKPPAKVIRLERKTLQTPKPSPTPGIRILVKDDPLAMIIAQRILNMRPHDVLTLNGPEWKAFRELVHVIEV